MPHQVNKFSLTDLGGGAFELRGRLDLSNVSSALFAGQRYFDHHDTITIDIAQADCASTIGIALLLEWSTWSSTNGKRLSYKNVPISFIGLARLNDVEDLLQISTKIR